MKKLTAVLIFLGLFLTVFAANTFSYEIVDEAKILGSLPRFYKKWPHAFIGACLIDESTAFNVSAFAKVYDDENSGEALVEAVLLEEVEVSNRNEYSLSRFMIIHANGGIRESMPREGYGYLFYDNAWERYNLADRLEKMIFDKLLDEIYKEKFYGLDRSAIAAKCEMLKENSMEFDKEITAEGDRIMKKNTEERRGR